MSINKVVVSYSFVGKIQIYDRTRSDILQGQVLFKRVKTTIDLRQFEKYLVFLFLNYFSIFEKYTWF